MKGEYSMCDHERLRTKGDRVYCCNCGAELPLDFLMNQGKPAEPPEPEPEKEPEPAEQAADGKIQAENQADGKKPGKSPGRKPKAKNAE